jgi:glutaredoxin 3
MSRPDITMYVTGWCGYCLRAKNLLAAKNIEFREINVDGDPALREEMRARGGGRTVPQIFIGEKPIGGYDELSTLERDGQLDRLIQGV